jgi:hypothetical protein
MTGRPRLYIDPEVIGRARELRAAGTAWAEIGERLGYSENTLRTRIDPDYAWPNKATGSFHFIREGETRVSKADAARALGAVPVDTRTRVARFMGDPIPGRSALDRMSRATRVSPSITAIHRDGNKPSLAERIPSSGG